MFGQEHVSEFVCKSWGNVSKLTENHLDFEDTGTYYALRLRKMTQDSCGLLRKLLAAFLTLTPHSMATERTVSHYNNVKITQRASLQPKTINSIMHISLNGRGTAFFDPRPAVLEFLKRKERRNRQPSNELYQNRDFIKTFFSDNTGCL